MRIQDIVKNNILLIAVLAAIALIRPIMKISGIMDLIGQQFGSILMTILISLAWLITVLSRRVSHPVIILVSAGIGYALFAILLSGILSPILDGKLQGPLTNPFALIGVFATNAIWGLLIGGLALLLGRTRHSSR